MKRSTASYILLIPALIVWVPIAIVLCLALMLITLPYTLFYFSPNWGMRRKDCPPVEVYLRHFESLYPDLLAYFRASYDRSNKIFSFTLRQWPHKTQRAYLPGIATFEEITFQYSAAFFAAIEDCTWDRRLVWEFLRDRVENADLVSEAERVAFARVMDKMTSHMVLTKIMELLSFDLPFMRAKKDPEKMREKEEASEAQLAQLGLPIEHVTGDSLEWILRRGTLVVANNTHTKRKLTRMTVFSPLWKKYKKNMDIEAGGPDAFWQLVRA